MLRCLLIFRWIVSYPCWFSFSNVWLLYDDCDLVKILRCFYTLILDGKKYHTKEKNDYTAIYIFLFSLKVRIFLLNHNVFRAVSLLSTHQRSFDLCWHILARQCPFRPFRVKTAASRVYALCVGRNHCFLRVSLLLGWKWISVGFKFLPDNSSSKFLNQIASCTAPTIDMCFALVVDRATVGCFRVVQDIAVSFLRKT